MIKRIHIRKRTLPFETEFHRARLVSLNIRSSSANCERMRWRNLIDVNTIHGARIRILYDTVRICACTCNVIITVIGKLDPFLRNFNRQRRAASVYAAEEPVDIDLVLPGGMGLIKDAFMALHPWLFRPCLSLSGNRLRLARLLYLDALLCSRFSARFLCLRAPYAVEGHLMVVACHLRL